MDCRSGYLITGGDRICNDIYYSGIENTPWPIFDEELVNCFTEQEYCYFEEMKEKGVLLEHYTELLNDEKMIKKYSAYCKNNGIKHKVYYIEIVEESEIAGRKNSIFLGFDVGQCNGDYYSALFSDVIWRPDLLGRSFLPLLNKNGLFNTFQEAISFMNERERKKRQLPFGTFEEGNMEVVAIYEMTYL